MNFVVLFVLTRWNNITLLTTNYTTIVNYFTFLLLFSGFSLITIFLCLTPIKNIFRIIQLAFHMTYSGTVFAGQDSKIKFCFFSELNYVCIASRKILHLFEGKNLHRLYSLFFFKKSYKNMRKICTAVTVKLIFHVKLKKKFYLNYNFKIGSNWILITIPMWSYKSNLITNFRCRC